MPAPSLLQHARLVELPQRADARGGLAFAEAHRHVPFEIRRVYYMYDFAEDTTRGAHAHKELEGFIIAARGSFVVTLGDGAETRRFELASPAVGLYVPRMLWRDLTDFSADAFCMVFASEYYDEDDYYRDFQEFRRARGLA